MLLWVCLMHVQSSSYADHIQNEGTLLTRSLFLRCPSGSLALRGPFSQFLWQQRQLFSCGLATRTVFMAKLEKGEKTRDSFHIPQTSGPISLDLLARKMRFLSEFQLPGPSLQRQETNKKPKSRKHPKLPLQDQTPPHPSPFPLFTYIVAALAFYPELLVLISQKGKL